MDTNYTLTNKSNLEMTNMNLLSEVYTDIQVREVIVRSQSLPSPVYLYGTWGRIGTQKTKIAQTRDISC